MYELLTGLRIDESKVASVSHLSLIRECGEFRLHRGELYACSPVAGRMVAVLFTGEGTFATKPPTRIEPEQLYRFLERDSVDMKFKRLFILFADSTWDELARDLPPDVVPM
jgi:hypothetical protein